MGEKRSMPEPMQVLPVSKLPPLGNSMSEEPFFYKTQATRKLACDSGASSRKKRKRVEIVVSKKAKECWQFMVMVLVSDASKG